MGRAVVFVLLPLVLAAFLVRIVAVPLLRRRWPAAAVAVERWWLWLPLVAILVVVTVARPLIGLPAVVLTAVMVTRASSAGSPFRPR